MSFHIALITPSRYDSDGYVQQWRKPWMVTQAQSVLKGLLHDAHERGLLGPDMPISMEDHYEIFGAVPVEGIVKRIRSASVGAVFLTGALSAQFPRTLDLARSFIDQGVRVVIGGVHVNGVVALFDDMPFGLQDALDMGAILFAGQAEGYLDDLLLDLSQGVHNSLYNYLNAPVDLRNAPLPVYDVELVNKSVSGILPIETSRGCPFKCTFCCIPNTQGATMQLRDPQAIADFIRDYNQKGVREFFLSDDNLARNIEWPIVFGKLAEERQKYKLHYNLIVELDTVAYKIPGFVDKAVAAGVTDVFIGLESIDADALKGAGKKQNRVADYREMFKVWYEAGCVTASGFIVGFPADTVERIQANVETLISEYPDQIFTVSVLTPLPGSIDHKRLVEAGTKMDGDLNNYDLGHLVFQHAQIDSGRFNKVKSKLLRRLYSFKRTWNIMLQGLTNPTRPVTNFAWSVGTMLGYRVAGGGAYEIGAGRFRNRLLRRPGLPIEPVWIFYPKYMLKDIVFALHAGFYFAVLKIMLFFAKKRASQVRGKGE